MQEIVKDERTFKIAGTVSLLLSLFLFVAFTSYLFTWQEDQDKVHKLGVRIFSTDDIKVNNLLGVLGAFTAHFFIFKGFGIASYLLCTFFFVLGVNLLFGRKVFSLKRNLKYVLVGLLVLCVCFAFIFRNSDFGWGGGGGQLVNAWLIKWIGNVGTGLLLLMAFFSYFVWRFNPTFHWPLTAKKTTEPLVDDEEVEEEAFNLPDLSMYKEEESGGRLYINKDIIKSNNKLKNNGKGVVVLAPEEEDGDDLLNELRLTERDEEPEEEERFDDEDLEEILNPPVKITVIPPVFTPPMEVTIPAEAEPLPTKPALNLELEIKEPEPEIDEDATEPGEEIEESAAARIAKLDPYEPTLDLRDYKYPTLDLLETAWQRKDRAGSAELETNKNQIITTLKNYDIPYRRSLQRLDLRLPCTRLFRLPVYVSAELKTWKMILP